MPSKIPNFQVRTQPAIFRRFEEIHRELNRRLPYGEITRGRVFEIIVNSASAALAAGQLTTAISHPPTPLPEPRKDRPG